ncbi:MAG: hypothetical protein GXY82_11015 [Methanospirillum sp.]|nr:hypothetical protein [Methanospirillum sp.]
MYVADRMNHRVKRFTSTGEFIARWGSPGSDDEQFYFPSELAVDAAGDVFVADTANSRVQKFVPGSPGAAVTLPGSGPRWS